MSCGQIRVFNSIKTHGTAKHRFQDNHLRFGALRRKVEISSAGSSHNRSLHSSHPVDKTRTTNHASFELQCKWHARVLPVIPYGSRSRQISTAREMFKHMCHHHQVRPLRFFCTDSNPRTDSHQSAVTIKKEILKLVQAKTQNGTVSQSDLYKLQRADFMASNNEAVLNGLLQRHRGLSNAIRDIFPEYQWHEWLFPQTSKGFFDDPRNQRDYIDWLAQKLQFQKPEDFYQVQTSDFENNHGRTLLEKYGGSFKKALAGIYPDVDWQPWRFRYARVPAGFWDDPNNVQKAIQYIQTSMGVQSLTDWQKVGIRQLEGAGFGGLLKKCGGLQNLVEMAFAHHNPSGNTHSQSILSQQNETPKIGRQLGAETSTSDKGNRLAAVATTRKSQTWLEFLLGKIFPSHRVLSNFNHPEMRFSETNRPIELDVFLPTLKLAFEFQGAHHYETTFPRSNPELQQKRDHEKRRACASRGITLIEVPYWWDFKEESLKATIKKHRPELIFGAVNAQPIPSVKPETRHEDSDAALYGKTAKKREVKTLMLARSYEESKVNPQGWLMSLKFDGVRALFQDGQFVTRNMKPIEAHQSVLASMQNIHFSVDGELFLIKRNKAMETDPRFGNWTTIKNALKRGELDTPDYRVRFLAFDTLDLEEPFAARLRFLRDHLPRPHPVCDLIPHLACEGKLHLQKFQEKARQVHAEGVILRDPHALYERGRSHHILKLKDWLDTEAKVLSHNPTTNTIRCLLPNGREFDLLLNVGLFRNLPPRAGSLVTFKHVGFSPTTHLPIQPSLLGIRTDISWDQLVREAKHVESK